MRLKSSTQRASPRNIDRPNHSKSSLKIWKASVLTFRVAHRLVILQAHTSTLGGVVMTDQARGQTCRSSDFERVEHVTDTQFASSRPHSISSSSGQQSPYQMPPSEEEDASDQVRIVQNHTRPRPRCFEHGCNGRFFSTFSNLLRHQRERSGVASKCHCRYCGAEFTRTTARDGHEKLDKCKQRRSL